MAECWSLQQKKKPDALVHTVNEPMKLSGAVVNSKPPVAPESKPQVTMPDSTVSTFHSCRMVQCL